jgi:hypothetical protein
MDKDQLKDLWYNCDDKYFPGHKCKEHNIFVAMFDDASEEEEDVSPMHELPQPIDLTFPSDPPEVEPMISMNALIAFFAP